VSVKLEFGGLFTNFAVMGPEDIKLLATLDVDTAPSDADEAIELSEPRRLVDAHIEDPPKPENPSLDMAGRDSSGKR
jgi:hypothetical protein